MWAKSIQDAFALLTEIRDALLRIEKLLKENGDTSN
jgi:hypothetical protein